MKPPKTQTTRKEESFRFATVVFMIVCFSCIIASLIFFEDNDLYVGGVLLGFGLSMLGVTLWTYFNPFYPVLLGLLLYVSLIGLLLYSYTDTMLHGSGKSSLRYIVIGLGVIVYALVTGYKEWKVKKINA
jgi:FtsH-binding integral membrane protein